MKVRIGKDFIWEMAHRLPFHEGPCKNIHGHSYKMRVELYGDLDANGMVLDFYNIGKIVEPTLSQLDHAFICDENDNKMLNFLEENNFKYYVMHQNSTSEYMAIHFAEIFAGKFKEFPNIDSLLVRIYETQDAFAEVEVKLK